MISKEAKQKYDKDRYHLVGAKKNQNAKDWYFANKDKARRTRKNCDLKRKYGITLEEYEQMLVKQDEKCSICGNAPNGTGGLHVDHKHVEGFDSLPREEKRQHIRGLLCYTCNAGIGYLKESPELLDRAKEYLSGTDSRGAH